MDPGVATLGLTVLGIGGAMAWVGRRSTAALTRAENRRVQDLDALPEGTQALLRATVECEDPMEDPIDHQPCIYFWSAVHKERELGEKAHQLLHQSADRSPVWSLSDETGSVEVHSEEFTVTGTTPWESADIIRLYALREGHASGGYLPIGAEVTVEARIGRRRGKVILTGPDVTVDAKPMSRLRTQSMGLLVAGVAMAILGLVMVGIGVAMSSTPPATVDTKARPIR